MSRFSAMVKLLSHSMEVDEGLAPRHRDLAGRCVIVSGKLGIDDEFMKRMKRMKTMKKMKTMKTMKRMKIDEGGNSFA